MKHLKEALKKQGKTQAGLAEALGRDKSAITLLLQGKRQLKAREILIIATYLKMSEAEVLGIPAPSHTPPPMVTEVVKNAPPLRIPVAGQVSDALLASGNVIQIKENYFYQGAAVPDAGCFMLEVADYSLELCGLIPGDLVLCDPNKILKKDDIILVKQTLANGVERGVLRKYQPPFLEFSSTRTGFERLHEERSNVEIIATIVELIRHYS